MRPVQPHALLWLHAFLHCVLSLPQGGDKGVKKGNQTPPPRSVSFKRCFFVFLPFGPWFRRACDTETRGPAVI